MVVGGVLLKIRLIHPDRISKGAKGWGDGFGEALTDIPLSVKSVVSL